MQNKLQPIKNIELIRVGELPSASNEFGIGMYGLIDIKNVIFSSKSIDSIKKDKVYCIDNIPKTTSGQINQISDYFLNKEIENYNDYTGLFEGKNLIFILMESVNQSIIDNGSFKNFNNLFNNGIYFDNYYSPVSNCSTGNNEFSLMTSLYPHYDMCSPRAFGGNRYFQSIFNLFKNKGYETYYFHDYNDFYYPRTNFKENFAVDHFYDAEKLGIEVNDYFSKIWPSDEELMEKSFNIMNKSDKPFVSWITTVTTHQPYNISSTYGDIYMDEFKGMGYSDSVSRYFSKMKVLDNALGILIDKLKENNILDNTVIILTGDHYPMRLSNDEVSSIVSHDISDKDIEKVPLLIYNPKLKSQTINTYSSYVDVLPTIANLFNLEYDSRIYFGSDLFSKNNDDMIIFPDGSWKNKYAFYNAELSNIKYYDDNKYSENDIIEINNKIYNLLESSHLAIEFDYFSMFEDTIINCHKD